MERELAALPRHLFNSGNAAEYHDYDKALSYAKSSHLRIVPLSTRDYEDQGFMVRGPHRARRVRSANRIISSICHGGNPWAAKGW